MNSIELIEMINILEKENKNILQELQLYECCNHSFIKELEYLKYKLEINNIVY